MYYTACTYIRIAQGQFCNCCWPQSQIRSYSHQLLHSYPLSVYARATHVLFVERRQRIVLLSSGTSWMRPSNTLLLKRTMRMTRKRRNWAMDMRRRTRRRLHNCDARYTVTSRSCIYRYFSCLSFLLIHDCACVRMYTMCCC